MIIDTLANGVISIKNPSTGLWDAESTWWLGDEITVGTRAGQGPQVFGFVWDFDVDELGRIYVLDLFAQEIRVFARDGSLVRTVGKRGSGPGEFRGANGMTFDPGGRLRVVNPLNLRYSAFDTSGVLLQEPRRGAPPNLATWSGVFSHDGDLYDMVFLPGAGAWFVRYDTSTNEFVDSVPLPSMPEGTPFGWGHALRTARGWWLGVASEYRLHQTNLAGDTIRIVERAVDRIRLVGEERASVEQQLDDLTERARAAPDMEAPRYRRVFTRLIVDDEDYLWVMLAGAADSATVFDVFAPDGRYLGAVTTPHRVDSLPSPVIRGDKLLFLTRDELDVPFVVMSTIAGRYR